MNPGGGGEHPNGIEVFSDIGCLPLYARGAIVLLGSFDGLHRGHQVLVRTGREIADRNRRKLAVFSVEPHPREFFGHHTGPFRLVSPEGKVDLLAQYGVDLVFMPRFDMTMAALSPREFVGTVIGEKVAAAHVVIGADYRFGKGRSGDAAALISLAAEVGCGTTVVDKLRHDEADISSTRVRDLVREGKIDLVRDLLGHHWAIHFSGGVKFSTDEWGRHWAMANIRSVMTPERGRYRVDLRGSGPNCGAVEIAGAVTFHPADSGLMDRCVSVDFGPEIRLGQQEPDELADLRIHSAIVHARL